MPHLTYRQLPDASLDEIYGALDAVGPYPKLVSDDDLIGEIHRRQADDQVDRMVKAAEATRRLTWWIAGLTGVVALATLFLLFRDLTT